MSANLPINTTPADLTSIRTQLTRLENSLRSLILTVRSIVDHPTQLTLLTSDDIRDLYDLLEHTRGLEAGPEERRTERLMQQARLLVDFVERVREWVSESEQCVRPGRWGGGSRQKVEMGAGDEGDDEDGDETSDGGEGDEDRHGHGLEAGDEDMETEDAGLEEGARRMSIMSEGEGDGEREGMRGCGDEASAVEY